MAERRHDKPAPTTDTEIRHEDWYGEDLSGQSHTRVAFVGVDLTETTGGGAVFTECTFTDVRFNASSHTDAAFLNCAFARCSFFDTSFVRCKLVGSTFDGCTFGLLKVSEGDWSFVGLPGADLGNAVLNGVRMREADLAGAKCEGATLHHVDLSGATLRGANLSRADLRGSDLSDVDPATTILAGAIIDVDQAVVLARAIGLDVGTDVPRP